MEQKNDNYNASLIIEKVLQEVGLNAPSFAKRIGLSYQRIFNLQNGRTKQFNSEIVEAIARNFPFISKLYLYTGEGEIRSRQDSDREQIAESSNILIQCIDMLEKLNERERQLDSREKTLDERERDLYKKEIELLKNTIALKNK